MTTGSDSDDALLAAVNAGIEDNGYKFGPVKMRRMKAHLPERAETWGLTDANGRRSVVGIDADPQRIVNVLYNRNKHRMPLDSETRTVQRYMDDAFEGLARGRVDIVLRDALDGRRDSFLCFQVDLDLLSPSLAWRRHRIDWRPYSSAGENIVQMLIHQRRRLKMLGGHEGNRRDGLLCDPVLARRIAAADNPCSWHDMLENALEDIQSREMPHFRDGELVHVVEMRRGVRWIQGKLTIYEQLPDTLLANLPGRLLSDVIVHEHIPAGILIKAAKRKGKSITITTDAKPVRLGTIIDELHIRAKALSPGTIRHPLR